MDDVTLTTRLCSLLGAIDGWHWSPADAYAPTVVGVHYGPTKGPGRAVGVRVYATDDDRDLSQRRVQVKYVGAPDDPSGADALADEGFATLQHLSRWQGIAGIDRLTMIPLGVDGNRREQRTDNYLITLDNEEAYA